MREFGIATAARTVSGCTPRGASAASTIETAAHCAAVSLDVQHGA